MRTLAAERSTWIAGRSVASEFLNRRRLLHFTTSNSGRGSIGDL
jgi:hypothetical protein